MSVTDWLIFVAIHLIFIASQLFWIRCVAELGKRFIPARPWRTWLGAIVSVAYLCSLAYNLATWNSETWNSTHPSTKVTVRSILLEAPFWWWFVGSFAGFGLVIVFWTVDRATRAATWVYRKARGAVALLAAAPKPDSIALDPPSPARRHFLEQTAVAVSATPFVAGAYGLLYGRLNVEVTRRRIALARLPKAFEGFRIVQLSDLHISPFMTADEIRRFVEITNRLKADLVALTGDFVTWDGGAQGEVVQALAGLHAPYGVFGCLGNHEIYTETQDSITRLFGAAGIRILRQACASIWSQGESINLIGVDFQGRHEGPLLPPQAYLRGVEQLVLPDTVNILLSHNPNSFDRAAQLGIDLSLAGHTHGGQVTLEFIHPSLSPGRLVTPYVRGWFQKRDAQLYVNRGIGTIGFPIRLDAPPEITVFELTRRV